MQQLQQISVLGMGLLGASISLAISRAVPGSKTVVYSHRAITRKKAVDLAVADKVVDDLAECVAKADLVILATPIHTFEAIFKDISGVIKAGCIVTDVGSTKVLPHRWARKTLPDSVYYVGSHPIAGSEKRGVEFARDDLLTGARCILTRNRSTNLRALKTLKDFWGALGCYVDVMTPVRHDKILSRISHLPHVTAAALVNASGDEELKFAGTGFMDTSRIASGPENIWADILATNATNTAMDIDRLIKELVRMQEAIKSKDKNRIEKLLAAARQKRAQLIKYKMSKKELL